MTMNTSRRENQTAAAKRPFFRGIYCIGLASTTIGIAVILLLNLATPWEYIPRPSCRRTMAISVGRCVSAGNSGRHCNFGALMFWLLEICDFLIL